MWSVERWGKWKKERAEGRGAKSQINVGQKEAQSIIL